MRDKTSPDTNEMGGAQVQRGTPTTAIGTNPKENQLTHSTNRRKSIRALASLAFVAVMQSGLAQTAAVPDPKLPVPPALRPLQVSPGAAELGALVQNRALTIDDVVGIALATNRSFATAVAGLERARGRTGEARSARNLQANVSGQLTEYDKPTTANFGGSSITLQNQFNPVYTASLSLPIDITGAIGAAISQAQFSEVAARIDVNRVRNQLVFDVRSAFYQALRAQGQLVVAQDTLNNAQVRLEDARAFLRVGTGTQFDVLTAQRDVADAQQSVVNARGQVTIALARLKNTMGIDVSTPISVSDAGAVEDPAGPPPTTNAINTPTPTTTDAKAPEPSSLSDRLHIAQNEVPLGPEYLAAVQEAVTTRPEVLESDAALSAARRGVVLERRRGLPTVSLSANYVTQPNAAGFTPENLGSVSLNFNIPIFEGGRVRSRVQQAEAAVALAQTDRRSAQDQVTLDVQQAYVNLVQARERVQVANVELTQAREAFRLSRVRAQAGVTGGQTLSPQLELSNAQATLTQAETNRVNALYDYNQARSDLDRAVGRYSYGVGPGYTTPPTRRQTGR